MKVNLASRMYNKGIGVKSKVKLNVGSFVDDLATAKTATEELASQVAARVKAAKNPKAATAEIPMKHEIIYFPIGTLAEVNCITDKKLEILTLQPPRRSENMTS